MEQFKPKTAVPLEVQRVLDAMTDDNWLRGYTRRGDKMCFLARAATVDPSGSVAHNVSRLYMAQTGQHVVWLNDREAKSLSDFRSKIIALYQEQ